MLISLIIDNKWSTTVDCFLSIIKSTRQRF